MSREMNNFLCAIVNFLPEYYVMLCVATQLVRCDFRNKAILDYGLS